MKLELWMIVATGVTCAAGFGILAVLVLSLDGQVRRLSRQAGALQNALEANLKSLLAETAAAQRSAEIPVAAALASLPAASQPPERPSMQALPPPLPPPAPAPLPDATIASRWTPERRLLVMRLAARGNPPDQIAAALRIPRQEIDLFIRLNGLEATPSPSQTSPGGVGFPAAGAATAANSELLAAAAAGLST